jgi:protein-L-isoaspartate(D-aspartate) O-methyltransferase
MVDLQLRRRGIRDERVLAAMLEIPREEFVPLDSRLVAYQDAPIHIGEGQTISQPYMTALMAESLNLRGTEHVLEVGAGCGYAAAVLGALAASVITVEILPRLAKQARDNLRRVGRDHNVKVVTGDGSAGYREGAPYDAISVAAGAPEIPATLVEQLNDPGILVIPVGAIEDQELRVLTLRGGRVEYRVSTLCRFVPLRGGEGWQ